MTISIWVWVVLKRTVGFNSTLRSVYSDHVTHRAQCVVFYSTCTMYACFRFIKWSNSFSNYHTAFSPTLYLWSTKVCLKIVCKSPDTQGLKAVSRCELRSTIFFDQYQTLLYVSNKKLLFAINFKTGNQTQTFPLITQTGRSYNVTCVFSWHLAWLD